MAKRTGPLGRREFMRASAVGVASLAAARSLPAAYAGTPQSGTAPVSAQDLPRYVGAGSTAPIRPFTLPQVSLGTGLFQEKRDRMKNFIQSYDQRRFLVLFNNNAGLPNPPGVAVPGGWEDGGLLSGHWTGHYLTALSQSFVDKGEQVFKDKLDWMVSALGACQDALMGKTVHRGYLGALPEDVVLRAGPPRFAQYGGDLNTNTWAPWYTQHKIVRGFVDAYTLTGNQQAFDIAVKMADWANLALTLGDIHHPAYTGPVTRSDLNLMWDTYIAGEYGGANEVYAEIYALTGDSRHLQTARCFDNRQSLFGACVDNRDILVTSDATRPPGRRPDRLHANQHVPNFTGYMRIFEQSGVQEYQTAAKNFFGMVVPHRMFAHGGTSGNVAGFDDNPEKFQNRDNIAKAIGSNGAETCTTYNLLKLARNLFFFDPSPAYMDYYERGLVNMIAGQRADTNIVTDPQVTYFQPLTPGSRKLFGNTGTCDGGTGMENHTKYQETIYFRSADDSTLWVNLYAASTLTWADRGFTITQQTDFPREQGTTMTVNGSGPLDIKLRVPSWVADNPHGFVVSVNGSPAAGPPARPGTYRTLSRTWSPGDTVKISMPFHLHIERAIDQPEIQSVRWGPLMMPIVGDPGGGAFRQLTLYRFLKLDGDYSRAAITPSGNQTFTAAGLTLRPQYVGDAQPQSPYFKRVEPEVVFGAIHTGVPNRNRNDHLPNYDVPVQGITSPGTDGLTFLDVVWDAAPFATHGDFVGKVQQVAADWVAAGLFTATQRDTVVNSAAQAESELRP